jgi:hypothetical protein
MNWSKGQMMFLRVHSVFCIIMGFMFAIAGMNLSPGNAAIPVSLAFTAMAMLGVAVGQVLAGQERRLKELEAELKTIREHQNSELTVSG